MLKQYSFLNIIVLFEIYETSEINGHTSEHVDLNQIHDHLIDSYFENQMYFNNQENETIILENETTMLGNETIILGNETTMLGNETIILGNELVDNTSVINDDILNNRQSDGMDIDDLNLLENQSELTYDSIAPENQWILNIDLGFGNTQSGNTGVIPVDNTDFNLDITENQKLLLNSIKEKLNQENVCSSSCNKTKKAIKPTKSLNKKLSERSVQENTDEDYESIEYEKLFKAQKLIELKTHLKISKI